MLLSARRPSRSDEPPNVNNFKSSRGLQFLVKFIETFCGHSGLGYLFFKLLSRDTWRAQMHFVIIKNFQTNVRWAWVHPTGSMTSHFVHFFMNYSFLVLKHLTIYYIVCNKASNIFDSTTCRPPVRLRWWLLQLVPSPFSTTNKDNIEIYLF